MQRPPLFAILFVACLFASVPAGSRAAVTPEQRKELAEISREVGEAARMIRRKQVDEAEKAIDAAEQRLKTLLDAGVQESDKVVGIIQRNVAVQRRALAVQRGATPADLAVSFSDDVAPIIEDRCLKCHGANDPRGGLRLDTYAGWKRGGASRQPLARTLPLRLTTPNPQQRMPKGEEALSAVQLDTIGRWIREGAPFDGRSDDAPIGEKAAPGSDEPVTIAKPEGDETVSFVKDVAPFMVNICGRCHMGNNPRGGFNITTFEGVMRGGESGAVIEPGDTEASRLWLMVSNREQPRMPPGQLLITRTNYDALTTWIQEGARFDGDDPKKPLRELIPSADQMRAGELAKLSPDEFLAHRRTKTEGQWKKAFPREQPQQLETDQFLVYGNVGVARLEQASAWADEQVAEIRSTFGAKDPLLWKGKLALFLVKDRFGYEEFSLVINSRSQVPPTIHGHAVVTPDFDEAYVVLQDLGDEVSAGNPGLKAELANLLTQALLLRNSDKLPDWAVQGTGLYMASKSAAENAYFDALRAGVPESLKAVREPQQLFADGTFPPDELPGVGFALVDYLVQAGGPAKFSQFLNRLSQSGAAPALQSVYRTTPAALATAFAQNAARRRGP